MRSCFPACGDTISACGTRSPHTKTRSLHAELLPRMRRHDLRMRNALSACGNTISAYKNARMRKSALLGFHSFAICGALLRNLRNFSPQFAETVFRNLWRYCLLKPASASYLFQFVRVAMEFVSVGTP